MLSKILSQLWFRRFVARNARPWQELREFDRHPPELQRVEMASRLAAQIRYFGTRGDALPEWRDAARLSPDDLWSGWAQLPIVTKDMLQSRFDAREIQRRFNIPGVVKTTGGSTGEPTGVLHDPLAIRTMNATYIYAQREMGWIPGMPIVRVWGSERDIGKSLRRYDRVSNALFRTTLIDSYRPTDRTVDRFLEAVNRREPVAVTGFTSLLEFVAQRTIDRGGPIPAGNVRTAWTGGEMLFDEQSALFRRAFGVPILNFYGGRELSVLAFQRSHGGPLELLRPWLFLEVVNPAGEPAKPGESGRLLWTSTVCRGTPFLRYEIGDLGSFNTDDRTEAGIVRLCELHGRAAGLITLPGGQVIHNLFWNHFFKDVSEVRQFQVIIKPAGDLKILLVGRGFSDTRESQLRATLSRVFSTTPFQFVWTDQIPLTSQGKLIQVVRESRNA